MIKDSKYIIKRVIIGVLIALVLSFIKACDVYAMDVDISYANSKYYDYTGVNSYNAIKTTRVLTDLQFYKFEVDPNDIDARDFMSVIYFPESVNDEIRTGQWDISFLIMTQGSPMVMLDTKGCELINPIPEETWYMFTDSQGHTYHDIITNEGQNTFYAVNCYNTSFINVPIRLRVFNTYEWSKQTITISRYWNFSQVEKPATNSGVEQAITNQTTQVTSSIDSVNSSINNDNIDSADSKANEWSSKSLSDNAVANMVTMPITLLQAYLNGLNGSCSSFSLGSLYDHELTLPCINLSSYFGSTLWNIIDILFSGFMIYALGKKFVKIFNDFTNLRDNQVDELYGGGN